MNHNPIFNKSLRLLKKIFRGSVDYSEPRIINCSLGVNNRISEGAVVQNVRSSRNLNIGKSTIIKDSRFSETNDIGNRVNIYSCEFGENNIVCDGVQMNETRLSDNNKVYYNAALNRVTLGAFTYIGDNTRVNNTVFGKFCSIAQDVKICLGTHPSDTFVSTHPVFYSTQKQVNVCFADKNYFKEFENLIIGNDVWIGANAIIKGGLNIGDGSIIGAGSVVTKDVPPYAIVGGIPARVIKYRFSETEIRKLLKLKWWDKDINWIRKNFKKFHDIKSIFNNE